MSSLARSRRIPDALFAIILRLLGRPFGTGETVVIKPSNVTNILMPELLRLSGDARALILYRDLPSYLRSIARKGMFGRIWARRLLLTIQREASIDAGFSESDRFIQTDLQVAAMAWLIQHAQFLALAEAMPDRVRLLDASALVADPRESLAAVCRWFGLILDPTAIDVVVSGPAFVGDSKRIGERFHGESNEDAPVDAQEIAMVGQWAEAVAKHMGVSLCFEPRLVAGY